MIIESYLKHFMNILAYKILIIFIGKNIYEMVYNIYGILYIYIIFLFYIIYIFFIV